MAQYFADDDPGYLAWKGANPAGFIVNSHNPPDPGYLVLHRVSCGTLRALKPGYSYWTRDYAKTCAAGKEEAVLAVQRRAGGGKPKPCGLCKP